LISRDTERSVPAAALLAMSDIRRLFANPPSSSKRPRVENQVSLETAQPDELAEGPSLERARCSSAAGPVDCDSSDVEIECETQILLGDLPLTPNQPATNEIVTQILSNKTLKFQERWFAQYPWLHYDVELKGVLCICCARARKLKLIDLSKCAEGCFMYQGFRNWKKALEKFKAHESSSAHRHATQQLHHHKLSEPIESMLNSQVQSDQQNARKCLHILFTTLRFLARQGLAIRGHDRDEGNFMALLMLRCEDQPLLEQWLKKKTNMTSSDIQNEILQQHSHVIIRTICARIRTTSEIFSVIVDGTQDTSGIEQESVCIRYVDADLYAHESFVGMYEASDSTGKTIASIVMDTLIRLQLPIESLRGQTYDGAANMAGAYNGCQAEIKKRQPLALYVHCGAHSCNLVAGHSAAAVVPIRDALQWVQELGTFYGASGKYKKMFASISVNDQLVNLQAIKPLCPTRWLTRCSAVNSVLMQYQNVLSSLEEAESQMTAAGQRARGLLVKFQLGATMMGLCMALPALELLENLNRSLQDPSTCVAGMLYAVNRVQDELTELRAEAHFNKIYEEVIKSIDEYDLMELKLPRRKQPPARLTGSAPAHHAQNEMDYYRALYYEYIDSVKTGLQQRFNSNDLKQYQQLESVLLHAETNDILTKYQELDSKSLIIQLRMFQHQNKCTSVVDATKCMREMVPEVRRLYPQVERLIRLLLISPASSSEAERSFSSLRRLKSWLRSTMTQTRLNSVAVCHTHQNFLDDLDLHALEMDFISRSDIRKNLFGYGLTN
jgi:Domain of unknown function (DUF4371)/hAT family C-terminal dimerisation region